jgi:hypothetical protein
VRRERPGSASNASLRQAHHLAAQPVQNDMSKIGGDLHKRTLGRDRGVRIAYDGQNNQTFTSTKQPALKMARKTIPYDGDNNSDLFRAKRVAARHLSGFQACGEPASALLGCAMGEGIWYNITLALPLQSIIANG